MGVPTVVQVEFKEACALAPLRMPLWTGAASSCGDHCKHSWHSQRALA